MKIRNSLKNRLSVSIFLIVFITGLIASASIFQYLNAFLISQEKEVVKNVAIEQSHEVGQVFVYAQKLAEKIAQREYILDYLKLEEYETVLSPGRVTGYTVYESSIPGVSMRLGNYNIGDFYSSISVIKNNGIVIASSDNALIGKDYSLKQIFTQSIVGKNFAGVFRDEDGELRYSFASPSFNTNGEVLGVVVVEMDNHNLEGLIAHKDEYENIDTINLVGNYGVVLYSTNQNNLLKSITNLTFDDKSKITDTEGIDGLSIENLGYELKQDVLSGVTSVVIDTTRNGEDVFLAISRVENSSFFIVVDEFKKNVTQSIFNLSYVLGFFVLISAIISGILIQFLVRKLINQIINISNVVRKATEGKLDQRLTITTQDEVGNLENDINNMISQIQKNIENIEVVVSERTKQLEQTNSMLVGRELKMIELKKKVEGLEKDKNK